MFFIAKRVNMLWEQPFRDFSNDFSFRMSINESELCNSRILGRPSNSYLSQEATGFYNPSNCVGVTHPIGLWTVDMVQCNGASFAGSHLLNGLILGIS